MSLRAAIVGGSQMAEHPNVELFRRGYTAFQSGDMDTLRTLLSPDVVWNAPGRNRFSGAFRGVDQVLNVFMQQAQDTDGSLRVEVHDILANDEHGVAMATISAQRAGKSFSDRYTHVVHIQDGKVTESWIMQENPYGLDEFWG
jgi:ketosteroid isomerase-like protein